MNYFSKNIRFLRKKGGLRQEQMGDYTGIARTTWSNYENNLSEPSIAGLIEISNFFGITLDELMLSDLETKEKEDIKKGIPKKLIQHYNITNISQEPAGDLSFIVKELKNLRKEVNSIKAKATGKKK